MPAADPIHAAKLDAQILALKTDGLSFRAISRELNYDVGYVYRCFQRGLRTIRETAAEDYKANQLARIAAQREVAEEILHATHVVVSNGHVVSEITGQDDEGKPIYGDPLEDSGPRLAAIDRLVKLDAQEADLLGLKAATKSEVSAVVNYTVGGGVDPAVDLT